MLARHGDARRVNHVGFDAMRPQPARQPKTIVAGLEGDGHARDRAAGPGRLALPAPQQLEQRLLVRLGVAGEQDAGRAVGQQDGHGVVVDLGEQAAFGVRRRSYDGL